ncbi:MULTISPECIES: phage tail sheath C-terminal domain-containing protein [Dickeya]|uniref:phage tail sheath family protein n=1 Tax=Dickeya TaxID=204037 RepID=UPI0003A8F7BD|nr:MULTISPECIES: phage tail sheath C-terminal domain-containing protein [Dickeya]AYH48019.1 phage tail protein [Dickeya fangzhongdai]UGA52908.1 phage tail sheath subtilisin-like domain-containing protein [Dickeya fangzhongdai]UWH09236.1 phage tail sheath subtilisin-like domain-containing protein [Dickeya fangzhongdai]WES87991.1 phage tail sheath C-terminal domain-containing protein [Dickeya fangzhongdai]
MLASNIKTPGVYINELNAFPNSVVPVATAVPAFIGYTPNAEYQGKSYYNKAQKITSFAEFQAIYMNPNPAPPADPASQYNPEYYLVEQKSQPAQGEYLLLNGSYYSIVPDPNTVYYLYNSIRLFYQNGGGDAYIVSVGTYGASSGKAGDVGAPLVNPNVTLADLQRGLALLQNEQEPTIYICPEATLLSVDDNGTLMQSMLLQAAELQTAVCLFDIIGGNAPDPIMYTNDIETFRNNTGSNGLNYGAAYYPFVGTTIMQSSDINFTNLFGGDIKQLAPILNPPSAPNAVVAKIIGMIETPPATNPMTNSQLNAALLNASQTYSQIINHVLTSANILPPSGAVAGVYTVNDNLNGVWHAPANTSIVGAAHLPIRLTDAQQADLNVNAVSGKSINAIRFFNGQGILIWGARTLDGNSQDWRYVSVRRTMTFLEQSVKLAARAYVFEPNNANTWAAVRSEIISFLTSIWKEGGLQGASAADAFQVLCGLGSTMTGDDLLNGFLNVTVKVAIVRPAEFLVITFEQEMAKSG